LGLRSISAAAREAWHDQGFSLFYNTMSHLLFFLYYKKLKTHSRYHTFVFRGKTYRYFYAFYHATYTNERAVEVPIVMDVVNRNMDKSILEVGNVLSHYFDFDHTIVDKYEAGKGVINQDIVDFRSDISYDLVVSISTLEHVGWDEIPQDDNKILRAIANMKKLLSDNGAMIITLPIGQNAALDSMIKDRVLTFDQQYYLSRISKSNEWKEASWNEVKYQQYNKPYSNANAIVIGIIFKTADVQGKDLFWHI
jgi:hypothetical protein